MMDDHLIENIRRLPDFDPSPELTSRVVNALPPKRLKGWRRFLLWIAMPRTITITPVKWAPVAACAVLLFLFVAVGIQRGPVPPNVTHAPLPVALTFRFDHPDASSVAIVGTFNNWMPGNGLMTKEDESGSWVCRIQVAPGRHEYAFLVDGKKILADPSALVSRSDGFGHYNSVIFATFDHNETI